MGWVLPRSKNNPEKVNQVKGLQPWAIFPEEAQPHQILGYYRAQRGFRGWKTPGRPLPETLPRRLVSKGLAHSAFHTNTNPPQGPPNSLRPDVRRLASVDCRPRVWTVCGLNASQGRKGLRTALGVNCACVGRKCTDFRQPQERRVGARASGPEAWGSKSTPAKVQGHAACIWRFIAHPRGPASVRCLRCHQWGHGCPFLQPYPWRAVSAHQCVLLTQLICQHPLVGELYRQRKNTFANSAWRYVGDVDWAKKTPWLWWAEWVEKIINILSKTSSKSYLILFGWATYYSVKCNFSLLQKGKLMYINET